MAAVAGLLRSRGRPRYLQTGRQPHGDPCGTYRQGGAGPDQALPSAVRSGADSHGDYLHRTVTCASPSPLGLLKPSYLRNPASFEGCRPNGHEGAA